MSVDGDQVSTGNLRTKIFSGGFTLIIRQVVTIVLKIVGVFIITRLLGPQKYGAYVASYGVFTYVMQIGQAGAGVYLVRTGGELKADAVKTTTALLLISSVVWVVGIEGFAGLIADYVKIDGFLISLRVMMIALPLQLLSIPALAKVERSLDMGAVAVIELVSQIAYYASALFFALTGWGVLSLAFATILQYLTYFILTHFYAKELLSLGWNQEIVVSIFKYTTSFSVASFLWQLRSLINSFIVGPVLGAAAVGIIGMAIAVMEVLTSLRTMIWRVTVAVLGKVQTDTVRVRNAITEGMELQLLVIGSAIVGFGWFGEPIVSIAFGQKWLSMFQVYPYIGLSYITMSTFNMHTAGLSVLNKNWLLAVYQGIHVVIFAAVAALCVPHFGIVGYGFGELAALSGYLLLHLFVARQVGSPNYSPSWIWWCGCAVGLFWHQLGFVGFIAPFAALLVPPSVKKLLELYGRMRGFVVLKRQGS